MININKYIPLNLRYQVILDYWKEHNKQSPDGSPRAILYRKWIPDSHLAALKFIRAVDVEPRGFHIRNELNF